MDKVYGKSPIKIDLETFHKLLIFSWLKKVITITFSLAWFILIDKAACKSNVHDVMHCPEKVRWDGPLWASMSGFNYENWNSDFKYLFH